MVKHHRPGQLARGGPYPRLRLDLVTKVHQARQVAELVARDGMSIRAAARQLDMSVTTAWRRYWWYMDWTLPAYYGLPTGPVPPQRGTRACPRGRPWLPTFDGMPR